MACRRSRVRSSSGPPKLIDSIESGIIMKTLIITEKPSVARDMAKVLGSFTNKNNYLESDQYIISWAYGHLLELVSPEQYDPAYKFWTLQKLPILPAAFLLQPISSSEKQLKELMSLIKSKQTDTIINACDAGREGELIFRNLLSYSKSKKSHQRLWLSSMTQEAIEKAFKNLKKKMAFEGIFKELKRRRYYEKPSEEKKRKKEEAERRRIKKMRRMQVQSSRTKKVVRSAGKE